MLDLICMATCLPTETATDFGCIPNDPIGFVHKFYGIGLGLIGGVAVLGVIYGGYLILTSQANPLRLEKGRNYILYSILGLLLAVFAVVFVQFIGVNLLHIPGFGA